MKNKGLVLLTTALLSAAVTIPAYAGWEQDEKGYSYLFDTGSYARNQMVTIDGVNYAFNQDAYMAEGWYRNETGSWYYFTPGTGMQAYGWLQLENAWYYLNPDREGAMQTSWLSLGNKRYYFDENGKMQTGAFVVDGFYYLAEQDGNLRRNVLEKEGNITIRYDDEGRQWYKNEESRINSKNGGDSWLPLLEESRLLIQREEVQENNADYIQEVKDDLKDKLKQEVAAANTSKKLGREIEKWKEKVKSKLSELGVSEEEITYYIDSVLNLSEEVEEDEDGNDYYYYEYDYQWD